MHAETMCFGVKKNGTHVSRKLPNEEMELKLDKVAYYAQRGKFCQNKKSEGDFVGIDCLLFSLIW